MRDLTNKARLDRERHARERAAAKEQRIAENDAWAEAPPIHRVVNAADVKAVVPNRPVSVFNLA